MDIAAKTLGYDVAVGIVAEKYFEIYGLCETVTCQDGTQVESCLKGGLFAYRADTGELHNPGILITDGYWTALAHEIGHFFGLNLHGEDYSSGRACESFVNEGHGKKVNGYWVGGNKKILNTINFMGTTSYQKGLYSEPSPFRWVSNEAWKTIFRKIKADTKTPIQQNNLQAPQKLILNGSIDSKNEVSLRYFILSEGEPEPPIPGEYSLVVKDVNNKILSNTSFGLNDYAFFSVSGDLVTIDASDFSFSIPFPKEAATISIFDVEGEILFETDPVNYFLDHALRSINDHCFIGNPATSRQELNSAVNALIQLVNSGNLSAIDPKIEQEIIPLIQQLLKEFCEPEDLLTITKEELLNYIEEAQIRLATRWFIFRDNFEE